MKFGSAALTLCLLTASTSAWADDSEEEESEEISDDGEDSSEGEGRFRWGIAGLGGPYMGSYKGGAGGLDLRFGWQLNDKIGIVGQPFLALGFGAQADEDSASVSATALSGVSVVVDYTVADLLYAGGGLGISSGGFASGSLTSTEGEAKAASGPFVDIPLRVGLALGGKRPNRRNAFTIGINGHLLLVPSEVSTLDADGNTETNNKFGMVFLPMIALGYEAF